MIACICLFFPAVVSVALFERFTRKQLSVRHIMYLFALNTMLINAVCFFVKTFFLGTGYLPLYDKADMIPGAALKYLIMAVPVSIAAAGVISCLHANITVTVEEEKGETEE